MTDILASVPRVPEAVAAALYTAHPSGSLGWMVWSVVLGVVSVAAGLVSRRLLLRWLRKPFRSLYQGVTLRRAERISYGLLRTVILWVSAAVFFAVGAVIVIAVTPEFGPTRTTSLVLLIGMTLYLVLRDLTVNVFQPESPELRLLPIDDATAVHMTRELLLVFAVSIVFVGISVCFAWFKIDPDAHAVMRIVASLVASILMGAYVLSHRKVVAVLIRGNAPRPGLLRKVLAGTWHILAIVYLAATTASNIATILLRGGFLVGPILGPIVAFVVAIALFGVCVILIDRRFRAQQADLHRASGGTAAMPPEALPMPAVERAAAVAEAAAMMEDDEDEEEEEEAAAEEVLEAESAPVAETPAEVLAEGEEIETPAAPLVNPVTIWQLRWKGLGEHLAAILAAIVGVMTLLAVWGRLSLREGTVQFVGYLAVLFATYALYQIVRTWIDGKIAEEEPGPGHGQSEDGMGTGSTRLATLLPLLRNLLLVSIASIGGMIVLSGLGVNVGPLFAGAGVVGLAVGFGAQTLIRDIFSGAFFLADDAFRKGEYIDVGGVMGSVEKISVRSFQLRHQNGPLHTVPFGDIKRLTNYSRDWVVMKLPLRLEYGTDVEQVRKLIKKLGQELLEDPEVGPMFLQPLKSQGVVQMEDSAMILRVKFMTRPGDQFVTRRHVYMRINELFEQEGIRFASRQVTVRIADDADAHHNYTPEERRQAALGAVQPILEAEAQKSE
ncbi:mechanosensitive ion channel family protein [Acuticoccus sp. 2012]|uniref:Mechanosensitive ion channel family protein n=2 Tax=Acuticoccus mangrovi TaxID=2796142 RepID=A0A934MF99_9HYPH|nr:mechanosensitive ion channel family protein [Acuticoccus mangrovi]